jgi:hypothetical protein
MIQPNNLRNRYRRMVAAHKACQWRTGPFRDWALYLSRNPDSYSAEPRHANYTAPLYRSQP